MLLELKKYKLPGVDRMQAEALKFRRGETQISNKLNSNYNLVKINEKKGRRISSRKSIEIEK